MLLPQFLFYHSLAIKTVILSLQSNINWKFNTLINKDTSHLKLNQYLKETSHHIHTYQLVNHNNSNLITIYPLWNWPMCIYHSVCGDLVLKFYCEDGADNIHHQQLINIIVYMYTSIYIIMFACMCVCMCTIRSLWVPQSTASALIIKLLILCMYVCMYVYVLMYVYNSNGG